MIPLRIKEILKQKGMSQTRLAAILQLSKVTVNAWTTGRSYPSLTSIEQMSKILDVPVTDFFMEPISNRLERISSLAEQIKEACEVKEE